MILAQACRQDAGIYPARPVAQEESSLILVQGADSGGPVVLDYQILSSVSPVLNPEPCSFVIALSGESYVPVRASWVQELVASVLDDQDFIPSQGLLIEGIGVLIGGPTTKTEGDSGSLCHYVLSSGVRVLHYERQGRVKV
jgi:hypothetical protein